MTQDDTLSRFVDRLNQYGPGAPELRAFRQTCSGETAALLDEAVRVWYEYAANPGVFRGKSGVN